MIMEPMIIFEYNYDTVLELDYIKIMYTSNKDKL